MKAQNLADSMNAYLAEHADDNDSPDPFIAGMGSDLRSFAWTFGQGRDLGMITVTTNGKVTRARIGITDPRDPYQFVCDFVGDQVHRLEIEDESGMGLTGDHRASRLIKTAHAWRAFVIELTQESPTAGQPPLTRPAVAVATLDDALLRLRSQPRPGVDRRAPGTRVRGQNARRELLEQLASEYLEFSSPRDANRVLAERHNYSVPHIKRLIREARDLRLLPATPNKESR